MGTPEPEVVEPRAVRRESWTTWRVYCRGSGVCDGGNGWPRLSRRAAVAKAREHVAESGHVADVVRLRYELMAAFGPIAGGPDV